MKLLTCNLFLRPPPVKTNEDDHKNTRVRLFIDLIMPYYDVICLQEVFSLLNRRKNKIIKNAIKLGYHYFAQSPEPDFFSFQYIDGGLLTLSRYPIVKEIFKPYPYGVMGDSMTYKGALYTKIQLPNHTFLHLFNTHLQASYLQTPQLLKTTLITRMDQIKTIAKFIHQQISLESKAGDTVLLMGDLNVDSRTLGYNENLFSVSEKHYFQLNGIYDEYSIMMQILAANGIAKDHLRISNQGVSPVTYGDVYYEQADEKPKETILTHEVDYFSKQSLDYAIEIVSNNTKESQEIKQKAKIIEAKVEQMLVTHPKVTQISDHYAVRVEMSL